MDVQRPEGSSPTHTLPSLSGGDNERERGECEGEFSAPRESTTLAAPGNYKTTKFSYIVTLKNNLQMSTRYS